MRVVVTDRRFEADVYQEAVEGAGGELVYRHLLTEDEVIEGTRDADIVVTSKAPLSRRVLEELEGIKLVLRSGAGYDNVNVKAASEYGIPVSNIPGKYCADELSEHAIALMLAAGHDVVRCDTSMRDVNGWRERPEIQRMSGATFGIIGFGHIGRAAARKARGLGMDVIAYDPYLPEDVFEPLGANRVGFEELLERADCVSIHAPLTQETDHLLSGPEFNRMKESAVVVNTARGAIIDEAALVAAVENGAIYGAGIDVFEHEPPVDSPVFETTRIVCSPHHGGRTPEAKATAIQIACDELVRAIRGEPLQNVVNPDVLKYGKDDPVDLERYDVDAYRTGAGGEHRTRTDVKG